MGKAKIQTVESNHWEETINNLSPPIVSGQNR